VYVAVLITRVVAVFTSIPSHKIS